MDSKQNIFIKTGCKLVYHTVNGYRLQAEHFIKTGCKLVYHTDNGHRLQAEHFYKDGL